jgi:hypothetical protein
MPGSEKSGAASPIVKALGIGLGERLMERKGE